MAWFTSKSRVSIIINCPKKDLFLDPRDVIITSQMAVSDLVENNNDNVKPLAVRKMNTVSSG